MSSNYRFENKLGEGGFGTVYSGTRISDNLPVAIKVVQKVKVTDWGRLDGRTVPMEICLLKQVSNVKGVIKLFDYYECSDSFNIVMERPEACLDLFNYITEKRFLEENTSRKLFKQIVESVIGCYENGVYHRDIKNENILVDLKDFTTRIVDFGGGTFVNDRPYKEFDGTLEYCSPEWIGYKYFSGIAATVWSLGIVLYDMVCGNIPFQVEEEILNAKVRFPKRISLECRDLIRKCLSKTMCDRPTLEQILDHPWMTSNV